ncbi:MAG: prepilin-type N-terminal cleavage/methylation domain-containing protein [Planctomycetota bacterium]|jgi:prepilin-type N-terminal cleavage/methylation domain-containing protein
METQAETPTEVMVRTEHNRAAFTMVEMAIAMVILSSVMGSIFYVLESTTQAFRTGSVVARMDTDMEYVLQKACDALRSSDLTPAPNGTESGLDFQRAVGVDDAGTTHLGDPERIFFLYDDGELDNGVDDDNDGLIDEGNLYLVRDQDGMAQTELLARDVVEAPPGERLGNGADDDGNGLIDDRGFSVVQENGHLTVRITLERVDPSSKRTIVTTSERTVTLRN